MSRARWIAALALACAPREPEPSAPTQPVVVAKPTLPQPLDFPKYAPFPKTAAPTRPAANYAPFPLAGRDADESRTWWSLGDRFVEGKLTDPAALALTDAFLFRNTELPEPLRNFVPVRDLGAFVLIKDGTVRGTHYAAVERATGELRWQLQLAEFGTVRAQLIAPGVLVTLFEGDEHALIAYSLADGREAWRLRGGDGAPFTRIRRAWSDDDRGYVLGDRGVFAFDPPTGAVVWSGLPVDPGCRVTLTADKLLIEDPAGHRLIDPATGALERRLPAEPPRKRPLRAEPTGKPNYSWASSDSPAPAVISGDLLFAFDPPNARGTTTLRALDLALGSERWHRPGLGGRILAADHDIVLVAPNPFNKNSLLILDAATGRPVSELSFGLITDVTIHPAGSDAGPLILVHTISRDWLLGRALAPPVPESYTIRGRFVPAGDLSPRKLARFPVLIGDKLVRSDARGRFEASGRTLGGVAVHMGIDDLTKTGAHFKEFDVPLDGRRHYDVGEIPLREFEMFDHHVEGDDDR